MSDLSRPATLRRLIDESGGAFAVIEEAVEALRQQMTTGQLGLDDRDVSEILRRHLLAIGSPSDVMKYFSLELLERADSDRAVQTYVEVVELLARSPLNPERTYPVERAMIRQLAEKQITEALPALALLAGREVYPLSRTAARAVAKVVGTTDQGAITDRLCRSDLPEASQPESLSEGVGRALFPQRRASNRSSQERRRRLTQANAQQVPQLEVAAALRPESHSVRQRRLRAILLGANHNPSRCGNCDQAGPTRVGHVVPVARGGSDLPGNLVSLCQSCRQRLPRRNRESFDSVLPTRKQVASPQLGLF